LAVLARDSRWRVFFSTLASGYKNLTGFAPTDFFQEMPLTSFRSTLRRISGDPSFRSAFLAFALTRAIIFFIMILASNGKPEGLGPAFGGTVQEVTVSLREDGRVQRLGQTISAGDALWYMSIARNGYEREPFNVDQQHTWAFFPLYPLLVSLAAKVTGEFSLTAALLSNTLLLAALIFMHKTVLLFGSDGGDADRAIFYTAAFPLSYFFSLPFTESLFLLLTVASFYFAQKDWWWRAGMFGALASATRLAGIFLLPALFVLCWQRHDIRKAPWRLLSLCLVPLGLVCYMLYLRSITGNALAFLDIQAKWDHRPNFFLRPLYDYVVNPLLLGARWDFRLLNFAAVVVGSVCCGVLIKRREWALAAYALLSLIMPLSAGDTLQSLGRYVSVIFPVFIVLSSAGRRPAIDQSIRAIFMALLGLMAALFALHVSLGLA
jgi:hypothetical protein